MIALAVLLSVLVFQGPQSAELRATLAARAPETGSGLRWSPKGATVGLSLDDGRLTGEFALGAAGTPPVRVLLQKSEGAEHFDRLSIDLDRDGSFGAGEQLRTTPTEQRGKWWSSFEATLRIPVSGDASTSNSSRPYPVALWFVEDPRASDARPALRWSRRGWHQGQVEIDGRPALVLITEMEMDGVFDTRDCWALARDEKTLLSASPRGLDRHAWLDGVAYRPLQIDPEGTVIRFQRFDPGVTEAEEKAREDRLAADRRAPRAEQPLAFEGEFARASERARDEHKRLFVDFQTTWCGPCKQMDELVYTSKAVVDAAAGIVAVKVDGDERRDLVERFGVRAYPTMILLEADGTEVRRAVGYQSVVDAVKLLRR